MGVLQNCFATPPFKFKKNSLFSITHPYWEQSFGNSPPKNILTCTFFRMRFGACTS